MPLPSRWSDDIKLPLMIKGLEDLAWLFEAPHNIIWMQVEEGRALYGLAARVPEGEALVEIGRAEGGSTLLLAAASPNRIRSIDTDPINDERLRHLLMEYGFNQVELMVDDSRTCPTIDNVGFLFIDGHHGEPMIRADFYHWFPHVVRGGIILFHDVCETGTGKGPWNFYNEIIKTGLVEPVKIVQTLAIVQKR